MCMKGNTDKVKINITFLWASFLISLWHLTCRLQKLLRTQIPTDFDSASTCSDPHTHTHTPWVWHSVRPAAKWGMQTLLVYMWQGGELRRTKLKERNYSENKTKEVVTRAVSQAAIFCHFEFWVTNLQGSTTPSFSGMMTYPLVVVGGEQKLADFQHPHPQLFRTAKKREVAYIIYQP